MTRATEEELVEQISGMETYYDYGRGKFSKADRLILKQLYVKLGRSLTLAECKAIETKRIERWGADYLPFDPDEEVEDEEDEEDEEASA
jgi:hypothetical protein